jgi:hypothetical protein
MRAIQDESPMQRSSRDVPDAETIVIRQRGALDWEYIASNLQPLAEVKDQPEIMATFERLSRLLAT